MRDSPAAAATLGINLTRLKVGVFFLSAGIAGVGGALFGGLRESAGGTDFNVLQSLPILLLAVIGGISTVTGALLGGLSSPCCSPAINDAYPSLTDLVVHRHRPGRGHHRAQPPRASPSPWPGGCDPCSTASRPTANRRRTRRHHRCPCWWPRPGTRRVQDGERPVEEVAPEVTVSAPGVVDETLVPTGGGEWS